MSHDDKRCLHCGALVSAIMGECHRLECPHWNNRAPRSAASPSNAAPSPLGGFTAVLAEYDGIVNGRLDQRDAEADFVMRGSDWRVIREELERLLSAPYSWARENAAASSALPTIGETPRTDAQVIAEGNVAGGVVPAEFARQLEIERDSYALAAQKAVERNIPLSAFQRKIEEAEARCCPEDVGFEEWIGVLTKRLNAAASASVPSIDIGNPYQHSITIKVNGEYITIGGGCSSLIPHRAEGTSA